MIVPEKKILWTVLSSFYRPCKMLEGKKNSRRYEIFHLNLVGVIRVACYKPSIYKRMQDIGNNIIMF